MMGRAALTEAMSSEMFERIRNALSALEKEKDIRILLAAESGSRAWGMHSKDSDYDVRFIYAHAPKWYVSTKKKRDIIDVPITDELDFHGWDIQKALSLLVAGNCTFIEWLNSPIQYRDNTAMGAKLKSIVCDAFASRALISHYAGFGKSHWKRYMEGTDQVAAKKYFYVIRPALALAWLRTAKESQNIPMFVPDLIDQAPIDDDIKHRIREMRELKISSNEWETVTRDETVDAFIQSEFEAVDALLRHATPLPDITAAADGLLWDITQQHLD